MKKFWKDNKGFIIVVLSLVFVICCSLFIEGNTHKEDEAAVSKDLEEWLVVTKEDESIVTVIAQTTCSHCINFKPVIEEVQKKYGFKLYWFEYDEMETTDRNLLTKTYDLKDFGGTPHTFIVKGGKLIAEQPGEMSNENLVKFLKSNKVIE